jgi:hypothetical protein
MSEAASSAAPERATKRINELRVSGHLMLLDAGLFCIVQMPSKAIDASTGLPGVRVSLPPGQASRPEAVSIATFRPDGWLSGFGDAALVRVVGGPAQIMVTVYQAAGAADGAPSLQVMRLTDGAAGPAAQAATRPAPGAAAPAGPESRRAMDMVAHIQGRGDVGALLGEWLGEAGSKQWIEGFAVAPAKDVVPADIEYQAVLGRGWLSPWVEGGQFCGSRGMALPVLGLKLRLRGAAAEAFDCSYSAVFLDGTKVGPVRAGEACEAESLSPLESFRIDIRPRGSADVPAPTAATAAAEDATAERAARSTTGSVKPQSGKPQPVKPQSGKPQPVKPKTPGRRS